MFPWSLFPFSKDMKNMMKQMKPDEIEKYVQSFMNQMMPQNMQGMMNPQSFMPGFNNETKQNQTSSPLSTTVFETHDYVFVRIPIKSEQWLKDMRIYHTSNQMIIEHIPEQADKHTIVLPAIVKKKGASALYKDGMLEIKIPKNVDMQYSEIDVTEIV